MKISRLSLLALCVSMPIYAAQTPTEHLISTLEKTQTFRAHFTQKIRDANGEMIGNTKGEVAIARPGKFYWKSQAPDPILVVADGHHLWNYDIDLSQVTKQTLKDTLKNSPAQLLAGNVNTLKNTFSIGYAEKNQCNKTADTCFALKPKQKDAPFSNILIGLSKNKLTEIKMHDPLGQTVYTIFSQISINGKIDPQMFVFTPPKGVDIIRAGAAE